MPGFMTFILLMHVSAGLLTASLAVPLMRRKVGPERPVRLPGPQDAGRPGDLVRCQCVRREVPLPFRDRDRPRLPGPYWIPAIDPIAYAVACPTILLVGLAVGLVLSFRHLDHLTRPSER